MRYRIPPRLSGKPYSRVRLELSPDKGDRDLSPPKLPIYLRSLLPVWFRSQQPAHPEPSASYGVSVRSLAGLGVNVSDDDFSVEARPIRLSLNRNCSRRLARFTVTFAGFLPTVRRLPAVAFASYSLSLDDHLVC